MNQRKEIADDGCENDSGQEVSDLDFRDSHQIRSDHDDEQRARAGHFVDGRRSHQRRDQARKQNETALNDKDRNRGKKNAHAERGGEHHGGNEIQHGLGNENGIVADKSRLNRARHRHRADAKQKRRGDEALCDGHTAGIFLEFFLHFPRESCDRAVNIKKRAHDRAENDGGNQNQHVFTAKASRNTDIKRASAKPDHRRAAHPFGNPLFQQKSDTRSQNDRDHVNNNTKHNYLRSAARAAIFFMISHYNTKKSKIKTQKADSAESAFRIFNQSFFSLLRKKFLRNYFPLNVLVAFFLKSIFFL